MKMTPEMSLKIRELARVDEQVLACALALRLAESNRKNEKYQCSIFEHIKVRDQPFLVQVTRLSNPLCPPYGAGRW